MILSVEGEEVMDFPIIGWAKMPKSQTRAEVFANMADAKRIAYAAWDQILTLGEGSMDQMQIACRHIQEAQPGRE